MGIFSDSETGRMFVNLFLASHIQSRKPFRFNEQAMPNWVPKFQGKPIVLFKVGEHFEHPVIASASKEHNMQFQQTKAVGQVLYPFEKRQGIAWRGIGEITIDKVKAFLKSLNTQQVPMFSSPQVAYTDPDYDIKDADPMHVALTDDPAFPPDISMITGVCEGDQTACMQKLASASAHNYQAGNDCFVCFADAMRDIVFNNAVAADVNNDSSLKISNFSNNLKMPDNNDNAGNNAAATQEQQQEKKSPAEITQELIESKAKDAVNRMTAEIKARTETPQTADPVATMKKATEGVELIAAEGIKEDPKLTAALKELDALKLKDRKSEISKVIPLQMVTDHKSGGINNKLLSEYVEYWLNTKLEPAEIAKFYDKQMETIEVMNPTSKNRTAKASNQDTFTNEDIAKEITKFDAPDVDNSKIANASAGNGFDPLEFAGMLVSNVSTKKGEGSARSMMD